MMTSLFFPAPAMPQALLGGHEARPRRPLGQSDAGERENRKNRLWEVQ
jgi:hypothetical protein